MPIEVGQRKFTATAGATVLILGLSFWGVMVGKLTGPEWVSAVQATCFLVGGFLGLNVASKVIGGKNGNSGVDG